MLRELISLPHNLVVNNFNELDQNNPILLGIKGYLENKYPGFYIGLRFTRDQYYISVQVRYSLKYYQDRFPDLFDRHFVFRVDLARFIYNNRLSRQEINANILTDILRYANTHLVQDIERTEGGANYLESYNITTDEFYQREIYNYRVDNFGNCDDPITISPFTPCPFEIIQSERCNDPILHRAIQIVEDEFNRREAIREQVINDYWVARDREFNGSEELIRQGMADLITWNAEYMGSWEESEETVKKKKEANEKAEKLLLEHLDKNQIKQYKKDKTFICYGHKTGTKYRVLPKLEINIEVYDNDRITHKLCITPSESTPIPDEQLAIKLMLEGNEEYLLKTAIPWSHTTPY